MKKPLSKKNLNRLILIRVKYKQAIYNNDKIRG